MSDTPSRYQQDPVYAKRKIESVKRYYARNREQILAQDRQQRVEDGENVRAKARENYAKRAEEICGNARAYREENAERMRERDRAYHAAHIETRRAQSRASYARHAAKRRAESLAYKQAHPEENQVAVTKYRARKAKAPVNDLTAAQWKTIKAAYKFRCAYCGHKPQRLTQDHITPLIKGGSHTLSNVVPACRSCNSRKNTGSPLKPVQPLLL